MTHSLTITQVPGMLVVRAGGAVLAETAAGLEATGTDEPSRWLPLAEAGLFLDPTSEMRDIPGIGGARAYDIIAKSGPILRAAWAVETPAPGAEALAGHVTFDETRVAVEQL
jgi:uncharacterized protein (DUF427 family)